ncbi:RrF2 family transcriptional regulator [Phascolarctobacterium sp.]|uniref:RrF2 family transcriptional regulator n=1 Tax=Phascolarctobacterium sp. TaxID=2049039 RepID=UPI00386B91D6
MKISTKGRYALRLMLDLAMHYSQGYIPLKAVAQRQEISDKYLEQIIHRLSKAGLVQSARGAQGGYRLTKDPAAYSVGEILRTVEGSLAPVSCLDCATTCDKIESCLTIGLYRRIQEAVDGVVDNTTLADMLQEAEQKQA